MPSAVRILLLLSLSTLLFACSTRHLQGSFDGATAQRLLTHSIDDIVRQLPTEALVALEGQSLFVETHFIQNNDLKQYIDRRLKLELENEYAINITEDAEAASKQLLVFYTAMATDRDNFGLTLPVGSLPGVDDETSINILTLEKFHGITELYYYLGEAGNMSRSKTYQAVVKTDALGLPFITIPISNLDRTE